MFESYCYQVERRSIISRVIWSNSKTIITIIKTIITIITIIGGESIGDESSAGHPWTSLSLSKLLTWSKQEEVS